MQRSKQKRFAPLKAMVACGRDFCKQTSMHGFIHIAAANRWWGERVFWAFVTAAAIWGAVDISLGQWQRYNENPTVVALEKDFRSWDFCFPGLTLCPTDRVDKVKLPSVIKKYWNVDPQDEKYARYERFVLDVANSSMLHLEDLLKHNGEDLEVDLYQLAADVLPESNLKHTWSSAVNVKWFPVMTEMGACYATNSVAIPDDALVKPSLNETSMFPLRCKYSSLNCYVTIESPVAFRFYIHSPYDILNMRATPFDVAPRTEKPAEFSVMESGCGRGVRELSPRRRGCLYTDEPQVRGQQIYSTNSCRRSCRNQQALKDCHCKPFYNKNEDGAACSLRGMQCLAERATREATRAATEAATAKAAKRARAQAAPEPKGVAVTAPKPDDTCQCPLMCVDALFEMLSLTTKRLDGPFSVNGVCRIKIQAPRTRYTREIVFYFQDLIDNQADEFAFCYDNLEPLEDYVKIKISFGGATGLFLGASFISFVEIVFFGAEWLMGSPARLENQDTPQKVQVKKSKVSHEQAQIRHLNAILAERTPAPGFRHAHLG